MRLLWLIDSLTLGGAETLAATFAIEARRRDMDVTVAVLKTIGGNPIESRLRHAGVDVVHLAAKNLRDVRAFRRLVALIRDERFDLIHSHLTYASIWGAAASARTRVPHVATLHTLPLKPGASAADRVRQRLLVSMLTRHAARVIAVSNAQRSAWINATQLRPAKVVVVPNGVGSPMDDGLESCALMVEAGAARSPLLSRCNHLDQRRSAGVRRPADETIIPHERCKEAWPTSAAGRDGLPAGGERVRVRGGSHHETSTVGTIATLRRGKGIDVLLTAFRGVKNVVPDATLIIAGDGALRESLQRQASELGIASSTKWLGYRDDVDTVLGLLDVFVHPTFEDALPTAVLEAMSAGAPVVASATGGIPEIVTHELNGLLVPPGDVAALEAAILRVLRDADLRRRFAENGRSTIELRFSRDLWIESLLGIYRDAMGETA